MNPVRILLPLLVCLVLGSPASAQELDKTRLAGEVKAEFLHCWKAYKQYAWGHDGLRPLSKTSYDWYSETFYMTALDALDTMILMGLKEEADSTREFLATHLSFDKDVYIKVFEFNIRFLGGLLSCYQLTGDQRLLTLAEDLARRTIPAFHSPTGMPYVNVNLKTGAVRDTLSNPAEIGTLLLEYGTLSMLTGKSEYYNYAKYAMLQLYESRSEIGLVGDRINIMTGEWIGTESHIGAAIDSYYEYMVKCALLLTDYDCGVMWNGKGGAREAIDTYLAETTPTGLWYGRADMNTGKRTRTLTGALEAFYPAVLALADQKDQAARSLGAFFSMWNRYGIEPELFDYSTMEARSPKYFLNPEIVESAYYLYKVTDDPRYLEMGKVFLDSLRTYCRTDAGYAELKSVITKEKSDRMETYFLAETLKYLYLLFAPPETLPFEKIIFNTEAHPLQRTW